MIERQLKIPARRDAIRQAAIFARECALTSGLDTRQSYLVELAMDEACANIVEHAYAGADGLIAIEARIDPHRVLTLEVIDRGKPFDPESVGKLERGAALEERAVGGLGMFIIRETLDEVRYTFDPHKAENRLVMTKKIKP